MQYTLQTGQLFIRMERVTISSALVLQERKLIVRKKFKRMRLSRKEGEKEKGGKKEEKDGKDKEKRKKRRWSLRPDLAEYKVFAKARQEKGKLFIEGERCGPEGKCEGPSRSTPSDPAEEFPPHCCRHNNTRKQSCKKLLIKSG